MGAQVTINSLLIQWYEEKQTQRIEKGFIDVGSIEEVSDSHFHNCDRVISLKQYKMFQAIFSKETKTFPLDKELCFVPYRDKTLVAYVSGHYNRGHISFKINQQV
jgi:predicted ATP-dependent Lon-type protease